MQNKVVIIGSGLGGLLCGYILSKHGYRVVILEKNSVVGGCLQSFRRKGYLFDTGMHYIGSMDEGQLLHRFWKYFQLTDTIKLRKLDENAFDIISYNNNRYPSGMGYERYVEGFAGYFPDALKSLKQYVNILQKVANSSPVSRLEESDDLLPLEMDYVRTSVSDYLAKITSNTQLQSILAGNLPLYGGVKGKTPFYIHAFIHNSYMQGAYRIVGGSQSVADRLTDSICKMGGEILTNSKVVKLHGSEKHVERVTLEGGRELEGNYFISDIHPQLLVTLFDENMCKRSYCRRVRQMGNTIGGLTLYIGFKKGRVPYMNSNFFHYNVDDIWSCGDYCEKDWPRGYLFMHQAPVDGSNFSDSALMISYMRFEEIAKWKGTPVGRRGDDYKLFKEQHAVKMLAALEKEFPGIRANIAFYNVSTPLTYEDYTGTSEGSMYGIFRDATSPIQTVISQQTYIPNLLMTGQSTNSHGMLGVTNGAMLTCAKLLGLNTIIRAINEA